jgi:3-mercaptopyruvate sulfurtransferase SseA
LAAVGVFDTPTIILTDDSGTISKIWKGELARMDELNVINALGVETAQTVPDWYINEKDLVKLVRKESVSIIDLREREIYKEGHLPKAINIPLDELPVRAVNELDLANTLALYEMRPIKRK